MIPLTNSYLCAGRFREIWNNKLRTKEVIYVLYLNNKRQERYYFQVCSGGYKGCVIDIREIVHKALDVECDYIIIAHNHTSGIAEPSEVDVELTLAIQTALAALDLVLVDHIILTTDDHYSFRDNGYLDNKKESA